MLGQGRLTLRRAEEAIRSERLEEALELIQRPEVREHRRAMRLRDRIAAKLAKRAEQQLGLGNSLAAWTDIRQAEGTGAKPAVTAHVRTALMQRGLAEIDRLLEAGNPAKAQELAERLSGFGAESQELRSRTEVARLWQQGQAARRHGEFSKAVELLRTASDHLRSNKMILKELETAQASMDQASPLRNQLHSHVGNQDWKAALHAADHLLELAPDCREARYARDEAWRRLGIQVSVAKRMPETLYEQKEAKEAGQTSARLRRLRGPNSKNRFILWVDGVGGYLVCLGQSVTIGQATPGTFVDVPVFADLSRLHCTVVRDTEGYLVQSARNTRVNGVDIEQSPLQGGDVIQLSQTVLMRFETPSPISQTAVMKLVSPHRLHLSLSGILLMADTLVLGPAQQSHVLVPEGGVQIVCYRQGEDLWCRADGTLEIDGQEFSQRGPLTTSSRVSVAETSFSLEPLGSPLSQV